MTPFLQRLSQISSLRLSSYDPPPTPPTPPPTPPPPIKLSSDQQTLSIQLLCLSDRRGPGTLNACTLVPSRNPFRREVKVEKTSLRSAENLLRPDSVTYRVAHQHNKAAAARLSEKAISHFLQYSAFLRHARLLDDGGGAPLAQFIDRIRKMGRSNMRVGKCLRAMTAYQTAVALGQFFGEPEFVRRLPPFELMLQTTSSQDQLQAWQCALSVAGIALGHNRPELFGEDQVVQVSTSYRMESSTVVDEQAPTRAGLPVLYKKIEKAELYITVTPSGPCKTPHTFPVAYEVLETRQGDAASYRPKTTRLWWEGMPDSGFVRHGLAEFTPSV